MSLEYAAGSPLQEVGATLSTGKAHTWLWVTTSVGRSTDMQEEVALVAEHCYRPKTAAKVNSV